MTRKEPEPKPFVKQKKGQLPLGIRSARIIIDSGIQISRRVGQCDCGECGACSE